MYFPSRREKEKGEKEVDAEKNVRLSDAAGLVPNTVNTGTNTPLTAVLF